MFMLFVCIRLGKYLGTTIFMYLPSCSVSVQRRYYHHKYKCMHRHGERNNLLDVFGKAVVVCVNKPSGFGAR